MSAAIGSWVAAGSTHGLEVGRTILWWIHVILLFAFLVYIPVSKHMHLIMCPVNEWFRNLKPRGAQIVALDLENEDIEEFGVSKVQGFTTKQLMDVYACAECGRCQAHCPATQSGKALNPKLLMTKLKEHLDETGEAASAMRSATAKGLDVKAHDVALIGEVFSEDEIWACTTCYSCQEQCPVQNEHINKIIDMRRSLVLDLGDFPAEAQLACRNIEKNSNPWGVGNQNRANWAKDLDVPVAGKDGVGEYLYWVGCAGSFDDRNQKVSKAIVALLRAAGVSFSILGKDEKCCGDPARRIGNEYLFQSLAAGEHRDPERAGRQEDHHPVPALPQHPQERIPRFRRRVRGHPPHPVAAPTCSSRAGSSSKLAQRGPAVGVHRAGGLPRLLLPGPLPAGIRGARATC